MDYSWDKLGEDYLRRGMALGEFFLPPVVVLDLPVAPAPPSLVTLSRGCRSNMVDWGNYKMQDCSQEKHVIVLQPAKSNHQRATTKMLIMVSQHLTKGGWRSVEQGRPHSHSCFDWRGAGRSNTP